VIIPTYNREKLLKQAIGSVLSQRYQNFEVFICDNGSSDSSYEMVMDFKDSRIFWLDGSILPKHPGAMRNLGINNSRGEILCFLDSDDQWKESHLTNIYNHLNNSLITSESTGFNLVSSQVLATQNIAISNKVLTSSVAMRKNLISDIGLFPEAGKYEIYEDYAYWLRASFVTNFLLLSTHNVEYKTYGSNSLSAQVGSNFRNLKNTFTDFENWCDSKGFKISLTVKCAKSIQLIKAYLLERIKKYLT
jgi:glycosyltransferase involved in cell wall biosynthesis